MSPAIAQRGQYYYLENRVRYLSLRDTHGFVIVEGTENYIVGFEYHNGRISQLEQDWIEEFHPEAYQCTGCFAAIDKGMMFSFPVEGKEQGSFTL